MAQNYKPRHARGMTGNRARNRGRSSSGLLLGLFIGFILGVLVAAMVALYVTRSPVPFLHRGKPAERPAAAAGQNLKDAPKAALPGDGKPRFDFYRILPGQEEPVTPQQLREARGKSGAGAAKEAYFLQAGSFQSPADADNMKAKLAFLGLESTVEPTNVPEKGIFYRVRLGPYTSIDELDRVRSQLVQNGIDPSLVKVRDPRNP